MGLAPLSSCIYHGMHTISDPQGLDWVTVVSQSVMCVGGKHMFSLVSVSHINQYTNEIPGQKGPELEKTCQEIILTNASKSNLVVLNKPHQQQTSALHVPLNLDIPRNIFSE